MGLLYLSIRRRISLPADWDLNVRKKLIKCYMWSLALYGAETLILQKVV